MSTSTGRGGVSHAWTGWTVKAAVSRRRTGTERRAVTGKTVVTVNTQPDCFLCSDVHLVSRLWLVPLRGQSLKPGKALTYRRVQFASFETLYV